MMKLYYAPNACSLADHIALIEAGARFEAEAVDIHTKRTASGEDFHAINPKGYVPALVLDDCEILTENVAVLDWIAEQYPQLRRNGTRAGARGSVGICRCRRRLRSGRARRGCEPASICSHADAGRLSVRR